MRAVVPASGQLLWRDVPDASAGAGEVLIKVHAAGVNRADLLQAAGKYPPPPGASAVMGLEVSGSIAAIGTGVTNFAVGQNVCALLAGGGYAEYVAVPAEQVMPIPPGVAVEDAAALPEVVVVAALVVVGFLLAAAYNIWRALRTPRPAPAARPKAD